MTVKLSCFSQWRTGYECSTRSCRWGHWGEACNHSKNQKNAMPWKGLKSIWKIPPPKKNYSTLVGNLLNLKKVSCQGRSKKFSQYKKPTLSATQCFYPPDILGPLTGRYEKVMSVNRQRARLADKLFKESLSNFIEGSKSMEIFWNTNNRCRK